MIDICCDFGKVCIGVYIIIILYNMCMKYNTTDLNAIFLWYLKVFNNDYHCDHNIPTSVALPQIIIPWYYVLAL